MAKKTNFGKWTLPTSWEQVTLGQLQRIEALRGEPGAAVKIMSVLSGKDEDEVRALPVQFFDTAAAAMSFLAEAPSIEPSCSCVIGGERYGVDVAERLTLGEWVAVQSVMQSDSNDVAGILAVVCRKDGEAYDSEFENEVYQSRRQMFIDAPCTEVLKVVAFFLTLFATSSGSSRRCSVMKEEALRLTRTCIGSLQEGGGGAGFFSRRSAIRKLRRLSGHIASTF